MKWDQLSDGTVWPHDYNGDQDGVGSVNWILRYGTSDEVERVRMFAASVLSAYEALIARTNKRRNELCNAIKAARKASRG